MCLIEGGGQYAARLPLIVKLEAEPEHAGVKNVSNDARRAEMPELY